MGLGAIGVSSSSAASSISSSNQSINFNPVITLASPESQIKQDLKSDQGATFDQTSRTDATATAKPTLSTGLGGGEGSGFSGFDPSLSMLSSFLPRVPGGRGALDGIESLDYRSTLGSKSGGGFAAMMQNNPLPLLALAGAAALLLFRVMR